MARGQGNINMLFGPRRPADLSKSAITSQQIAEMQLQAGIKAFRAIGGNVSYDNQIGATVWIKDYEYHREDGPAVEFDDGTKMWFQKGELHRLEGPAIEHASGTKEWFILGARHRSSGPAVEYPDGQKEYWSDGVVLNIYWNEEESKRRHELRGGKIKDTRKDGRGFVVFKNKFGQLDRSDGPAKQGPTSSSWYQNDLLHRVSGPAIDTPDVKEWFRKGQLHNEFGPAVINRGYKEWFLDGNVLTEEEWKKEIGH